MDAARTWRRWPGRRQAPLALVLLFSALSMGLAGCAGLGARPEAPRVSLAGLDIQSIELFEQRYVLHLRLQNPNDFDLHLDGLEFTLDFNRRAFASGVSRQRVRLPAFGEAVLDVQVSSNLARVFDQLQGLPDNGAAPLSYAIHGSVKLSEYPVKLPFRYSGELTPPGAPGETR